MVIRQEFPDTSTENSSNPSHPPRESVTMPTDAMMLRETSFEPACGHPERLNDFAVQLQTASRAYLSKRGIRASVTAGRLSRVSSASSLAYLTREARYARAESALRVALSRCEKEPSPLELQVRVLEKGLQAWNARAGRGYERLQKAEAALAAARRNEEGSVARSSFSELQREKWMGIKERDEALAMVEKIKGLIKELNTDIMEGPKTSPNPMIMHSAPRKDSDSTDDIPSKKVAILFSGKFPMPYLENLPRSRRSVEPLRLPLQVTNLDCRRRSSTLLSEPTSSITSHTLTTQPSTPHPVTPTDDFGAAVIHTPLSLKSMVQHLAEIEETHDKGPVHSHMRLPSYVGALLDELGEDRIGDEDLRISEVSRPSIRCPPVSSEVPMTPIPKHKLRLKGSNGLLGRPFSNLSSVPSLYRSSSQYFRSKENHDPSMPLHTPSIDSTTVPEKLVHTNTTTGKPLSSFPFKTSLTLATKSRKRQIKSPGRVGNLMDSVKRGVMKVSWRGE